MGWRRGVWHELPLGVASPRVARRISFCQYPFASKLALGTRQNISTSRVLFLAYVPDGDTTRWTQELGSGGAWPRMSHLLPKCVATSVPMRLDRQGERNNDCSFHLFPCPHHATPSSLRDRSSSLEWRQYSGSNHTAPTSVHYSTTGTWIL